MRDHSGGWAFINNDMFLLCNFNSFIVKYASLCYNLMNISDFQIFYPLLQYVNITLNIGNNTLTSAFNSFRSLNISICYGRKNTGATNNSLIK